MSGPEEITAGKRQWLMFCVLAGLTLGNLGSAIVNIGLPDIARSFHASDAASVWVVNAYQVAGTACLLPVAALGESFGLKRVYAAGLIIFSIASLGCALSPNLSALVIARLLQGAGAACLSVASVALVRVIYPRHLIGKALAVVALGVAIPGALGPTVASMILAVADWPWLFLVNVPIGILSALIFIMVAPRDRPAQSRFDFTGATLNILAFGFLIVGLGALDIRHPGFAIGEMLIGLFCFALFVGQQSRKAKPMLAFDLLRVPSFALSMFTSTCSYTAQILAYVSLPFMFEATLHLSPVATGLLVTPWPLLTAAAAPISGRLANRFPTSVLCCAGLATLSAGLLLIALLPAQPALWNVAWRLAICGIGFGLFQTPNNISMMTAGPVARSGAASGMNAVARYIGWSVGSALVTVVFGFVHVHATEVCLVLGAGFTLAGAIASGVRRHERISV